MHNSSETAFKIFSSNLNMSCLCMDICFVLGWSLFGFLNVQVYVLGFHQTWEFSITSYSNIFQLCNFSPFLLGFQGYKY